jgi:hypothetical protein
MRFLELVYNGRKITNNLLINDILEKENLNWLIDSEIENAEIEIKNHTLIWKNGYFFGNWHYGIFKDGQFYGTFENGILEGGKFNGNFISGLNLISV